ncbi:MbtH family protein [Streptomyces albiaxialis]|uniref:MbtH family protein n=1 Tax=Streptomyces albiaxialis TaxID=329523 RepID=A0ABN2VSD9_9ACTN
MTNPFENDDLAFLVLVNSENQHSIWPAHLPTPGGWTQVHGPAPRQECLAYVEREWVDMRPRSLVEQTAAS